MPSDEEVKYFQEIVNRDKERIDLITVTYYRLDLTKRCLSYLLERTKTPYRLTVIDNGSRDGTVGYLTELLKDGRIDNLILLDRNYGLEMVRNTALKYINSEYCVFFDNDLLVPDLEPDWLSQELTLIKKYPQFGCIALRPQVLVGPPNDLWDTPDEIVEFKHVGATFMMFKTDLIKTVGWDDSFTNRVADWRLGDILSGVWKLKMGWCKNIFCHHLFGKNWSYPEEIKHFHREMWPPAEWYDQIKVDDKTLKPNE